MHGRKRLRSDPANARVGPDTTHSVQLTTLPDLVLHHIISGLEWKDAVALRQVDRACQLLVLRDHRPLRFVLVVLLPRVLDALPQDRVTSPFHAVYWDWFKAAQTRDFATRAPLVDDHDECDDDDEEEEEDDFEPLETDELELLQRDTLQIAPPSVADGGDVAAMDLEPITEGDDNDDEGEDTDDDGDDDDDDVDEGANDKVKLELEHLQAWRLQIEARLHQLSIEEPNYWRSDARSHQTHSYAAGPCRAGNEGRGWSEEKIAIIVSIIKKYVRVKAHVRFEGEEAINVACILELCAPGGGGWTLSLAERGGHDNFRPASRLRIDRRTERGCYVHLLNWHSEAYISDNIVNTELLVEVARALGIPDWSPDEIVRFLLDCAQCRAAPPAEFPKMTSSAEEVDDTFPTLAKVWARLGDEDQFFSASVDRYPVATLEPLLRAVQRMQFHLQKPCVVRVGSELDYVAFADIQRILPRITLGTATAAMVASNEYEGESYAWGSARLRTVETPSEVLVELAARTDSLAVGERFGLSSGQGKTVMAYFTGSEFLHRRHLPGDLDLPKSIDPTFFDELARSVGAMPPDVRDSEAADDNNEAEAEAEATSQSQLTAEAERRVRMAMVLAVCVLGPATRYDGLHQPAPEDFFDGHKPIAWFHHDPAEEVFACCLHNWLDEQTFGFS